MVTTSPSAKLSREEPDAGNLHVRVCGGRGWQHPRLPGDVKNVRLNSPDPGARKMAERPHQFREMNKPKQSMIVTPRVSSEGRAYLPVGLLAAPKVISDRNFALYDAPLWNIALIASRLHWVWVAAVCVRLEMRFPYSNTLGWNTFPVPTLTEKNKADLTRCAEDILLAREAHFPATIADLYDPENMPADLREAHERNDEVLERIYIGRRFRNDTERLEKLFDLYTKMTAGRARPRNPRRRQARDRRKVKSVPSVSVSYARNGSSTKANDARHAADAGARL